MKVVEVSSCTEHNSSQRGRRRAKANGHSGIIKKKKLKQESSKLIIYFAERTAKGGGRYHPNNNLNQSKSCQRNRTRGWLEFRGGEKVFGVAEIPNKGCRHADKFSTLSEKGGVSSNQNNEAVLPQRGISVAFAKKKANKC